MTLQKVAVAPAPRGRPRVSAIYGPVYSWRYRQSLGVDLLLRDSVCSLQCAYCQLGRINVHTRARRVYVTTSRVLDDLDAAAWKSSNVITFSGSGEPTLAANLGESIVAIRKATRKPIVVLTNSTLLNDAAVRAELAAADTIACKLDAPSDDMFRKLNHPIPGVTHADLIAGLKKLRTEFTGKLALQLMLMPINAGAADRFAPWIAEIAPDEVQINVPSRPKPREWSLATRGEHQEFGAANGFRLLPHEEVAGFARDLAQRTGVRVIAPPAAAHSRA